MYNAFHDIAFGSTEVFMVFCYGFAGTGKTHLLKAMVNQVRLSGKTIGYVNWAQLIDALKRAMGNDEIPGLYDLILHNYLTAPALAIDDLGMGTTNTQWENSILERIVVERYERRLLTAIVSNKDITELPDRVISRFKDQDTSIIVVTKAKDYRPTKGK